MKKIILLIIGASLVSSYYLVTPNLVKASTLVKTIDICSKSPSGFSKDGLPCSLFYLRSAIKIHYLDGCTSYAGLSTTTGVPCSGSTVGSETTSSEVCSPNDTPWLKLLSPNGGEIYRQGQQITIRWTTCNIPASEKIIMEFKKDQYSPESFGQVTSLNDGIETSTIQFPPEDYLLEIFTLTPQFSIQYSDFSDNRIIVNSALIPGCSSYKGTSSKIKGQLCNGFSSSIDPVKVLSPNGGEVYPMDSIMRMNWRSVPDRYYRFDVLSKDKKQSWLIAASSYGDTAPPHPSPNYVGSWTVGSVSDENTGIIKKLQPGMYYMKISLSINNHDFFDVSDLPFYIVESGCTAKSAFNPQTGHICKVQ